ncbi:MAG: hypothetical protein KU37_05620 [Sulfuricurvum sp. PC08-66]|nr:MAG: hypothetical protein KU37_05620 [Sulfuricurvum sp. PC08-66]
MKLLVSAVEPSANMHLKALMAHMSEVLLTGIFDPSLGAPIADPKSLSVMGFIDTFRVYRYAKRLIAQLVDEAKEVDKILLIDAPAFNIPLAKALKKRYPNKKIFYYILPKVWAWKPSRIKLIERYVDVALSIFPFEEQFYPHAIFVGNPLMDEIKEYKNSPSIQKKIAFLPGSRKREIRGLMPVMRQLRTHFGDYKNILVIPHYFDDADIARLYGDVSGFVLYREAHEALLEAKYAYVCSGTATLESAIIGTPLSLLYITHPWEFALMKYLVKLPYAGLANIIMYFAGQKAMHPEFFQDEVNVDALRRAYESHDAFAFMEDATKLRALLGSGTLANVAKLLQK